MADAEQDRRDAQVIAEHLPDGYTAEFAGTPASPSPQVVLPENSSGSDTTSMSLQANESSLLLQGGDMHRGLFVIESRAQMGMRRANTFHSAPPPDAADNVMPITELTAPQGFRRAFVRQRKGTRHAMPARTFVDFLDLYGSFAGEDLRDSDADDTDDDDDDDDDDETAVTDDEDTRRDRAAGETRPLLPRRRSAGATSATAGTGKTLATLLKAFIGTGIMFLPKAFANGGLLFSCLAMLTVAALSMWSFRLLLACKAAHGGGYGDIGEAVAGRPMRALILASVTLSQLGFVCAGIVFVAENLASVARAVWPDETPGGRLTTTAMVGLQVLVLVPLAWIRNMSKLGRVMQVADVFIFLGLAYVYWYSVGTLARSGLSPTVVLFNPARYTLTVGSVIFTFEGIGLILPIQSSMRDPRRFEWLLGFVMLVVTAVFTSVGALCYMTFGAATDIEVINNFPRDSLASFVQFLYSVAVLMGNPVQLFPAMRILEANMFAPSASGKRSPRTKWRKNAFRAALVVFCAAVAVCGAGRLDFFVALIGSFACIPLVYIYPPYLHYRALAPSPCMKAADLALMGVGVVGMAYTTVVTLSES